MGRLISFALHLTVLMLIVLVPVARVVNSAKSAPQDHTVVTFHLAPLPLADTGGGGNESPTPPSKGRLPRFAARTFIPPPVVADRPPLLAIEPTIAAPEDPAAPNFNLSQIGDPFGAPGAYALGPGRRGIGMKGEGGYGDKDGPGASGDGELRGDEPITGPQVIYKSEPEFSDEARKAKVQGTVVLEAQIGPDGRVHNVRVRNGLGLGLDEKALEAVARWRFRPAMRRGKAIAVPAVIEINFRLL